ncbi:hypothetical protein TcG_08619 [Trypanosoma cruzi]|nr:hypothetical protein TcG_08619 [Trypanosoma cruzi]
MLLQVDFTVSGSSTVRDDAGRACSVLLTLALMCCCSRVCATEYYLQSGMPESRMLFLDIPVSFVLVFGHPWVFSCECLLEEDGVKCVDNNSHNTAVITVGLSVKRRLLIFFLEGKASLLVYLLVAVSMVLPALFPKGHGPDLRPSRGTIS